MTLIVIVKHSNIYSIYAHCKHIMIKASSSLWLLVNLESPSVILLATSLMLLHITWVHFFHIKASLHGGHSFTITIYYLLLNYYIHCSIFSLFSTQHHLLSFTFHNFCVQITCHFVRNIIFLTLRTQDLAEMSGLFYKYIVQQVLGYWSVNNSCNNFILTSQRVIEFCS